MGKRIGEMLRDMVLVMFTFMPALFAYAMLLYWIFQDPVFSFYAAKVIAPLISATVVAFYGSRFKPKFRLVQALILCVFAVGCSYLLPLPAYLDPTIEGSMGPVFTFAGIEILLLFVMKVLLDILFGFFPAFLSNSQDEEAPFYT